jgi:endonuclease-3
VTRAEKAARIGQILDELYPRLESFLHHRDPFTHLVAVILSAQCTDARVNRTTPDLFAKAATAEEMARLPVREIERIIRPCGLAPSKARSISRTAKLLLRDHGGRVPASFAALEALPGVGHKTASVVMAQSFGQPAFPVDTHIHRLAARWGLSLARNVAQTERDLKKLFPPAEWGRRHLQLIAFGREHCPARAHDLHGCRVCAWAASKARIARERARKRPSARRGRVSGRGARARSRPSRPSR